MTFGHSKIGSKSARASAPNHDETSTHLDKGITQAVPLRFLPNNLHVLYRTSRFEEVEQLFLYQVWWDVVDDQVTATRQVLFDHF